MFTFTSPTNCVIFACGLLLLSRIAAVYLVPLLEHGVYPKICSRFHVEKVPSATFAISLVFFAYLVEIRNWITLWLSGIMRMCLFTQIPAPTQDFLFTQKKCCFWNSFWLYVIFRFMCAFAKIRYFISSNLLCVVYMGFDVCSYVPAMQIN